MTLVVGLTGGIGSGKSAVADAFARSASPSSTPTRSRTSCPRPGSPGNDAVVAAFGPAAVAARRQPRSRLAPRAGVRGCRSSATKLEALLHPLIRDELDRRMATWRAPYGLLVVPLLLERGGARSRVDRVLVVDCPEDDAGRRVMARSGLARRRRCARSWRTQLSRAARLAQADDVLDNSGAREAIAPQVARARSTLSRARTARRDLRLRKIVQNRRRPT